MDMGGLRMQPTHLEGVGVADRWCGRRGGGRVAAVFWVPVTASLKLHLA